MLANTEEPQLDNIEKVRDFGVCSCLNRMSITPFPSGLRDLCRRGGRMIARIRGDGWLQGNCLPDTMEAIHRRSHRDCSSLHKTWTSSHQTKFWDRGGEVGNNVQPITKKLFPNGSFQEREDVFSGMTLDRSATLQVRSLLRSWPTQIASNYFCGFLFYFVCLNEKKNTNLSG